MLIKISSMCLYYEKKINKALAMTKNMMKILKTLLKVGFKIMIMLMVMLKYEIIAKSLENIEFLHIKIVISTLN